MEDKNNFYKLLKIAIIMFFIIASINIGLNIYFNNRIKIIQKKNFASIESLVQNIKIQGSQNNYKIIIDQESAEQIKALSDKNYKEFIIQYNENQSNWFNTWLTILSIILGVLGLIIPICFMKLYYDKKDEIDKLIDKTETQKVRIEEQKEKFEDKLEKMNKLILLLDSHNQTMDNLTKESKKHKEEMDKIIEDTQKQKDKMQLQVDKVEQKYDEIKEKSEQVSSDLEQVKKYLNEITKKSEQTSSDLKETRDNVTKVEKYVNEMRAISKYNEGLNKISNANNDETKEEEGLQLYLEANKLDPNNPTIIYAIGNYYACKKQYEKGIKYLNDAIALEPKIQYYNDLFLAYYDNKNYEKAVEIANLSINAKDTTSVFKSRAYSIKALISSEQNDINATIENIENALKQNISSYKLFDNLAVAYLNIGKYDEAIELLEDSNKKYPLNKSYYNLIEAYIYSCKFEKAWELIQESRRQEKPKFTYIYIDDYDKWLKVLNNVEPQTETMIKIRDFVIDHLEKRDRENDK